MMVHRVIKKSAARPSLPITSQVLVEVRMDREPLPHSDPQGPPPARPGVFNFLTCWLPCAFIKPSEVIAPWTHGSSLGVQLTISLGAEIYKC